MQLKSSKVKTKPQFASEGELFKKILGDEWLRLHPDIQKRFSTKVKIGHPLKYSGTLDQLACSFWGKWLARFTQFFIPGALIPHCSNNCLVNIDVYTQSNSPYLYKKRIYHTPNRKPIQFISYMKESEKGEVLEYVGFGIGMKLLVFEKDSNLHFKSDGYFIDIGICRIPIPNILSPGDVYLMHITQDKNRFRISIEITHRILGKMFIQKGEFYGIE